MGDFPERDSFQLDVHGKTFAICYIGFAILNFEVLLSNFDQALPETYDTHLYKNTKIFKCLICHIESTILNFEILLTNLDSATLKTLLG